MTCWPLGPGICSRGLPCPAVPGRPCLVMSLVSRWWRCLIRPGGVVVRPVARLSLHSVPAQRPIASPGVALSFLPAVRCRRCLLFRPWSPVSAPSSIAVPPFYFSFPRACRPSVLSMLRSSLMPSFLEPVPPFVPVPPGSLFPVLVSLIHTFGFVVPAPAIGGCLGSADSSSFPPVFCAVGVVVRGVPTWRCCRGEILVFLCGRMASMPSFPVLSPLALKSPFPIVPVLFLFWPGVRSLSSFFLLLWNRCWCRDCISFRVFVPFLLAPHFVLIPCHVHPIFLFHRPVLLPWSGTF